MLVLNLPFKALMFLTLMRPSLVLSLVLWLKLVKDFLNVRCRLALLPFLISFFFNDTATTEIYTLSLHDALPISLEALARLLQGTARLSDTTGRLGPTEFAVLAPLTDRKSTRLNSSHLVISYAVFCLKKKKEDNLYMHLLLFYYIITTR